MGRARRRTPSSRRPSSTGELGRDHWRADGREKTRFPSEAEANRASLRLRLESGTDLDPYACPWCGGWHLGTGESGRGRGPNRDGRR